MNYKLPKYVAWKPDPFAFSVDAFMVDWSDTYNYIFPPFSLIGKNLQKIEEDEADVVMVAPLWPTKAWFSKLLLLLIDCPFYFNRRNSTNKDPNELPSMTIIACSLSGKICKQRNFQQQLRTSLCRHGGQVHRNSMTDTLKDGSTLQIRGVEISLHRL